MINSTNKERKELINIEELSSEEVDELDEQFFNEYPEHLHIKERNSNLVLNLNMSKWSKVFMFLAIGFCLFGFILLFNQGEKSSLFKYLFILSVIFLVIFIISSTIESKKFNKELNKLNEFIETPEYKKYEKDLDDWYKKKGYYIPEEPDFE